MVEMIIVMTILGLIMSVMYAFSNKMSYAATLDNLNNQIVSLKDKNDKESKIKLEDLNKQVADLNLKLKESEDKNGTTMLIVWGTVCFVIIGFIIFAIIDTRNVRKAKEKEEEEAYAILHPVIPEKVLVWVQDTEDAEYVLIHWKKFKKDLIKQKLKVKEKWDDEIDSMWNQVLQT